MKRLTRYLLSQFGFLLVLSLAFFTVSIVLSDLLVNLSKLVPLGVGFDQVVLLSVLYLPQALSWSLAPSLLFSVSFVLGTFYAHNELVVVFGSGMSLRRFTSPLFLVGAVASVFLFFWNDQGVVGAETQRQELQRTLQGTSSKSNNNVALLSDRGRRLVSAAFYNDQAQTLSGVIMVWKDDQGAFVQRSDAEWGVWKDGAWEFHKVKTYQPDRTGVISYRYQETFTDAQLTEGPEAFQKKNIEVNELTFAQALAYVDTLKRGGLPSAEVETDALQRISFSFAPFVVIWISAAIGGRFRKNILLMSLLISLLVSASYVILQMVFGLLAKTGVLPPWVGASAGVMVGAVAGFLLFTRART